MAALRLLIPIAYWVLACLWRTGAAPPELGWQGLGLFRKAVPQIALPQCVSLPLLNQQLPTAQTEFIPP